VAFDARSGAERQRLAVSCMRFAMSPDASRLAVIGEDKLSMYATTGQGIAPEPLWSASVPSVFYQTHFRELAFASDGRTLGVRIGWDDFRSFDVTTGQLLQSHGYKTGYPDNEHVVLGPGGRSIVVTSRKAALGTRLLSFDTGATLPLEPPARLLGIWTSEGNKAFRWTRDGQRLLGTARLDNPNEEIICLWDVTTGKLVASWPFGSERVEAAIFTRDEKGVLAVSDTQLWQIDITSGAISKHARKVREIEDLALSPDGRFLFSGDEGGAIRRWDVSLRADTTPAVESYGCAAVSSGGAIALVGRGDLTVLDAKGEHKLSGAEAEGRVKFSPSGESLVTGGGALQVWSTRSYRLVAGLPDAVFWQPFVVGDGWFAFTQYESWFLQRRKVAAGQIVEQPPLDLETPCIGGNFSDIALARDQSRLAVVYGPGFDQDYCASADADTFPENARARPRPGVATAPYRLRVYDPKRWTVVASRGVHGDQRPSVAISADGGAIALGTKAGIEIWSSEKRRTVAKIETNAELAELVFIPDHPWVAVGLGSGKVQVHDYEQQSVVADLDAHAGAVVCLDAAGTRLVSTGFEGTAVVWSVAAAPPKKP
jgi:WD40 repeat protein